MNSLYGEKIYTSNGIAEATYINYEGSEIVSMTAHMLGASRIGSEICGTVSSGGTESILLAMKAYRIDPADITPTVSLGITIDHSVAMSLFWPTVSTT